MSLNLFNFLLRVIATKEQKIVLGTFTNFYKCAVIKISFRCWASYLFVTKTIIKHLGSERKKHNITHIIKHTRQK